MSFKNKFPWTLWVFMPFCIVSAGSTNNSKNSAFLDDLFRNYDKRFRPNFEGPPTEILGSLLMISMVPINEVTMEFTTVFYLRQEWKDHRLAYGDLFNQSNLSFTGDIVNKLWLPDTFIESDLNDYIPRAEKLLIIYRNGRIFYSVRKSVKSFCPMEFLYFPFDQQVCELSFESYAYTTRDIIYTWKHGNVDSLLISERLKIPQYSLIKCQLSSRNNSYFAGDFSSLTAGFVIKRNIAFHIVQTYIPSALIVVISWAAFWIDEHSIPARVTLAITTILAITTLFFGVQSSLPKAGHVKVIDIFLFGNFVFVFGALVEYALICYLTKRRLSSLDQVKSTTTASLNSGSPERDQLRSQTEKTDTQPVRLPGFGDSLDTNYVVHIQNSGLDECNNNSWPCHQFRLDLNIDQTSRVLFPAMYVVFLVVYSLILWQKT